MSEARFTEDHEWVQLDGEVATCGISDYAQDQLGDVVFVELPEIGRAVVQGEEVAVIESVKAAAEVYAPLAGEVVDVNGALEGEPALVNAEPMAGGWFFKLRVSAREGLDKLMDEAAYTTYVAGLE